MYPELLHNPNAQFALTIKFHVDDVVQLRGAGTESRLRGMVQDTFYDQDDLEKSDRIVDVAFPFN